MTLGFPLAYHQLLEGCRKELNPSVLGSAIKRLARQQAIADDRTHQLTVAQYQDTIQQENTAMEKRFGPAVASYMLKIKIRDDERSAKLENTKFLWVRLLIKINIHTS